MVFLPGPREQVPGPTSTAYPPIPAVFSRHLHSSVSLPGLTVGLGLLLPHLSPDRLARGPVPWRPGGVQFLAGPPWSFPIGLSYQGDTRSRD